MSQPKDAKADFSGIRQRAEKMMQQEALPPEALTQVEAGPLIHQLRVHQIELELQNEELRAAQVKLLEARDRYADLYDFAPVGYLTLDEWGRVTEANLTAASFLKVERGRLLGKYFWQFVEEEETRAFQRLLANPSKLPRCQEEFHLKGNDDEVRLALLNFSFQQDEAGKIICRLSFTDITELKQAQRDLEKSHKELRGFNQTLEQRVEERTSELKEATIELESFSYTVAHDLKAPLRAIEGFSKMMVAEHAAGLDEEGRRLLQVVMDNCKKMRTLIDDLHNLASTACQQMRKTALDLAAIARAVFARLQELESGRDLRLLVEESPPARGDYGLLYQVLTNLLGNAIKFTRGQKIAVIEVGGRSNDRENIYYIRDNGVGFDQAEAHKMFVVFQRLNHGQEFEGTGVGLALVQRIIQRHGGRVWAEGEVGKGATFYFSLPNEPGLSK